MPMIDGVMAELPPLISDSDLHISQLTLHLLTSMCHVHPTSFNKSREPILNAILTLIKSPLLQGKVRN